MCPQPPLDSIINPCLTAPVIGAYITGPVATLINFFLIFLILRTPRKTTTHYLLALFIFTIAASIPVGGALAVLAGNPQLALKTYQTAISLVMPLTICAFYWFVRAFLRTKERWLLALNIICAILLSILGLLNPGYFMEGVHWNGALGYYEFELNPKTGWVIYFVFAFFWIWSSGKLFQAYRRTRSVIERNRLKYLISAPLVFLVGTTLITIPTTHVFPFDMVAATITTILLTYAIVRYQLLDITVIIRKGLLYSILTTVVTGIYLFFSLLLQLLFRRPEAPISLPATLSTALVVALVFQPLQNATQKFIDRVFFRKKYDPQEFVSHLSEACASTLDLKMLTESLVSSILETLQIGKAGLFLVERGTNRLHLAFSKGLEEEAKQIVFTTDRPLAQFLNRSDDVQLVYDLREKKIPLEELDQQGLELFVPLRSREKLRGVLALGPKLSEELYSLEELGLLQTVADPAALALENAQLFTQIKEEKERVEKLLESER